jgi:hypothetical protein
MITLTFILAALVVLTFWDAAEMDESPTTVPVRTDDDLNR